MTITELTREYNASLKALRLAEIGSDLATYEAADAIHTANKRALCKAEAAQGPNKFQREWIRQANRGWMF